MVATRVDTRLVAPISARYSTPPLSGEMPSQLSMLTMAILSARVMVATTACSLRSSTFATMAISVVLSMKASICSAP
ncbi:hypothetical protein D3C85_1400990 [compost metagenome]